MSNSNFAGDKKVGASILGRWEKRFVAQCLPRIPDSVETYHLTLLTLLWSLLALLFFWLAKSNLHWLWAVSALIVLQYFSDLFDGALGRRRGTGLIKWGFYMDHLLDYVFQSAIVIGYSMIAPEGLDYWFFGLLLITGGYMVNSFLWFAATNRFEISYFGIGPTEVRILAIVLNAAIIFIGTSQWRITVPVLLGILLIGLAAIVYRTQKQLWKMDMQSKREQSSSKGN